jgi:2'-5' RNA ligase
MNFDRKDRPRRPAKGYDRAPGNQAPFGRPQTGPRSNRPRQPIAGASPQGRKSFPQRPLQPKPENRIYFIALLPTAEVGKEIIRLKQEFAERYGARHAVKVLPHITIQVPFTADPALEKAFCSDLLEFAATQPPFEVKLSGFGSLRHKDSQVLFINVEKTPAMADMHGRLMSFLRREFCFSKMLARTAFTPHITVAFKDLTGSQFDAAWPAYEHRPFEASFKVNNLYFLRHNGASWEVLQKCRLGG